MMPAVLERERVADACQYVADCESPAEWEWHSANGNVFPVCDLHRQALVKYRNGGSFVRIAEARG